MLNDEQLLFCQQKLGFHFAQQDLLIQALTHRSLSMQLKDGQSHNERLEFLGDALLNFIVSEYLFQEYPDKPEGQLSKMKAILVSRQVLAEMMKMNRLQSYVLLSEGEHMTGGRDRVSILANVFEALVGAIYLDSGLTPVYTFLRHTLINHHRSFLQDTDYFNYKSRLQEFFQGKLKKSPSYIVIKENGPDHDKLFEIQVSIGDSPLAVGSGNSKKMAQQNAAKAALFQLGLIEDV